MECLACFLHDSYQANLRRIAQLQHDRFEKVIEIYRDLFINELGELSKKKCNEHDKEYLENGYIVKLLDYIKDYDSENIKVFFNEIRNIYLLWLKSDSITAIEKLKEMLTKHELFDFSSDISKQLMFRGRWNGDNILTSYDMFHIPYDKRYLIGNQRYSLPGIPLLYLGSSPLVVYSELGATINKNDDIEGISISYFSFRNKDEKKIYNLTNPFYELLEKYNTKREEEDLEVAIDNLIKKETEKKLFQFIFMSLCSFEKRAEQENKNYKMFYEEYIIPQILTQVLKNKKFDGIQYSSTRLYNNFNDMNHKLEYKKNIVLFTEYSEERHYDFELYKKFEISRPISYLEVKKNKINDDKLKNLNEIIIEKQMVNLEQIYNLYETDFSSIKIEEDVYNKHKVGEVHEFLMYNYFLAKKNERGN